MSDCKVILIFLSLFLSLEAWCGKVETLFLHTRIATNFDLIVNKHDVFFSKFLNGQVAFTDAEYNSIAGSFPDPALGYLCISGLKVRIALYNSGKFKQYLRVVKDVWQLNAYLKGKAAVSMKSESKENVVLFLQDALLLLALTEYVGAIAGQERNEILAQVLSLTGLFIFFQRSKILHNYKFVNFADFLETTNPLPIEYTPQDSILGKVNADRFLRLMDTHLQGVYDLTNVCKFIELYKVSQKYLWGMMFLKGNDESLELYARNRVRESSLIYHLTNERHGFGYILKLPSEARAFSTLFSMEQATFELNHLFPTTNVAIRFSSSSMLVEFAKLTSSVSAEYTRAWLDIWKYAFCHGLTEVVDYQFIYDSPSIIRDKLRVLKVYFRNNVRLFDVLQLERMFEALMAQID